MITAVLGLSQTDEKEDRMFSEVHHVGYLVEDLEAAIQWYEATFGGKYTGGGAAATGSGRIGFIQIGGVQVELIEPGDKSGLPGGGGHVIDHVGYVVDDLDRAVADFRSKGYRFATQEPFTNVAGYRLIFFDTSSTNGMRIHLTEASSLRT